MDNVIPVEVPVVPVVQKKKVLILTASPLRDEPIDKLLAKKLMSLGCETMVSPCLRGGREAALKFQPNVVVVPPIRNPFSADMVETLKRFGCSVVTRHTEPSCDWQDFKRMEEKGKAEILGPIPYNVDFELVWGPDEAEILNRRGLPFRAISVGAFGVDVYKDPETTYKAKAEIEKQHSLDPNKKTILILSAWGFIDVAPDLYVNENTTCSRDTEGRSIWIKMITDLKLVLGDTYNILVTLHPNIDAVPYETALKPLGIPIDKTNQAAQLVKTSDIIIHAGSTVSIGAHFLDKPCFQYGDQNQTKGGWWNMSEAVISKVSPFAKSTYDLINMIKSVELDKSNANPEALKNLELGRYGLLDGHATDRAASMIIQLRGQFNYFWPDSSKDYTQIGIMKHPTQMMDLARCGVCKKELYIVKNEWSEKLGKMIKFPNGPLKLTGAVVCPHCGSRIVTKEEM